MKCDVCGRHEAAAMIALIVNGKRSIRRVCKQCIAKMKRGDAYAAQMALFSSVEPPEQEHFCPMCGTSWSDVLRRGTVGCGACYLAFAEQLEPLLNTLNGMAEHNDEAETVKAEAVETEPPAENDKKTQITRLREEMFTAVNAEEYERAAQLRDQIRSLEREEEGGE